MNLLKKATVAIAASSLVIAPVAASAAPQAARADATVAGNDLGAGLGGSWLFGLIGLGLLVFGALQLFDSEDTPTSP